MASSRSSNRSHRVETGKREKRHQQSAPRMNGTIKATKDQIERAKLIGLDDMRSEEAREEIQKVADVTKKSYEEASIALHDNNFNTSLAIQQLLEGDSVGEWMTCGKKGRSVTTNGVSPDFGFSSGRPLNGTSHGYRGGRKGGQGARQGGSRVGGFGNRSQPVRPGFRDGVNRNSNQGQGAHNKMSNGFSVESTAKAGAKKENGTPASSSHDFSQLINWGDNAPVKTVSWADQVASPEKVPLATIKPLESTVTIALPSRAIESTPAATSQPPVVVPEPTPVEEERHNCCTRPGVVVVPLAGTTESHHVWYPSEVPSHLGVCKIRRSLSRPAVPVEMPHWTKAPEYFAIEFGDLQITVDERHASSALALEAVQIPQESPVVESVSQSAAMLPDLDNTEGEEEAIAAAETTVDEPTLAYSQHEVAASSSLETSHQQVILQNGLASLPSSTASVDISNGDVSQPIDTLHASVLVPSLVEVPRNTVMATTEMPSRQSALVNEMSSVPHLENNDIQQPLSLGRSMEASTSLLHNSAVVSAAGDVTMATSVGEQHLSLADNVAVTAGVSSSRMTNTSSSTRSNSQSKSVSPTMMMAPGGAHHFNMSTYMAGIPPYPHYPPDLETMQQRAQMSMQGMRDNLPAGIYQQGGDNKFVQDLPTSTSPSGNPSAGSNNMGYLTQQQQMVANFFGTMYPHAAYMYHGHHLPPFAPYAYPPPMQQKGYGPGPYIPPNMPHGYSGGMPGYEDDFGKTTYQTGASQGQGKVTSASASSLPGNGVVDSYKNQGYENSKPVLPGQFNMSSGAGQSGLASYTHNHTNTMLYGSTHQQHGSQVPVSLHSHQTILHPAVDGSAGLQSSRISSSQPSYPGKIGQGSKPYTYNTHASGQLF